MIALAALASVLAGCAARNTATNAQASTDSSPRETPAYRYGTGFEGLSEFSKELGGVPRDPAAPPSQPAVVVSPTAQPRETVAYRFGYGFTSDDSAPAQEAAAAPAAQPAPPAAPVSITPQQKPAAR